MRRGVPALVTTTAELLLAGIVATVILAASLLAFRRR